MSDSEPNPPELERLFRDMREDALADHEVSAVVEGVRSRIGGPGGGGGGGGSAGSSLRAWLTGGMLLAAMGGGALLWSRANIETPAREEALEAAPPVPSAVSPATAERTIAEPEEEPTQGDSEETESAIATTRRAARPTTRSRVQESESPDSIPEHVLLSQARQALPNDPRRALSLSDSHRRLYPSGLLAPEREMIAIDALLALGRERDARARAAGVLRRWPSSSHAARLISRDLVRPGEED